MQPVTSQNLRYHSLTSMGRSSIVVSPSSIVAFFSTIAKPSCHIVTLYERRRANMKSGVKKVAPSTPEAMAVVAIRMEMGNMNQYSNEKKPVSKFYSF